jgi:hypothetical protein
MLREAAVRTAEPAGHAAAASSEAADLTAPAEAEGVVVAAAEVARPPGAATRAAEEAAAVAIPWEQAVASFADVGAAEEEAEASPEERAAALRNSPEAARPRPFPSRALRKTDILSSTAEHLSRTAGKPS